MADGESSGVKAAYRELHGYCAEALALVGVLERRADDSADSVDMLCQGCMLRLADAVESYEAALRKAGVDVMGLGDE